MHASFLRILVYVRSYSVSKYILLKSNKLSWCVHVHVYLQSTQTLSKKIDSLGLHRTPASSACVHDGATLSSDPQSVREASEEPQATPLKRMSPLPSPN